MTEVLLYSEVNILCIAVLGIIARDIKKSGFTTGVRPSLLLKYIGCLTLFYMIDVFGKIKELRGMEYSNTFALILLTAYFLVFSIAAHYWFIYSEILHDRNFFKDTKRRLLSSIPSFLVLILLLVSVFNGCIFYIDQNGDYHRGKLFFVQSALSYGYFVIGAVRCFYYSFKVVGRVKKRNLRNFFNYSLITLICGMAQFKMGSFPLLIMGNTISILGLYLMYTGTLISNDPLTQIPNRRKLMLHLSETIKNLKTNEDLWFMFVDIDHFKHINDKYGHIEGNRILKEFTIVIKDYCEKNFCFCARYGGDEFAIVQKLSVNKPFTVPNDLPKFAESKNILIDNTHKLSASIGYTKYNRTDNSVDDMIKRADKEMYRVKMQRDSV